MGSLPGTSIRAAPARGVLAEATERRDYRIFMDTLDRGYIEFARFWQIHQSRASFVALAKSKMNYRVPERRVVEPGVAMAHDRLIHLRGPRSRRLYPETLRRVRYTDQETNHGLTFLTNRLKLDATNIALSYRKRWKVELLSRWMKQHLHIKAFFGTTPNAVKTQLWIAVLVLVLLHWLKHRCALRPTPNKIAQILSATLCGKTLMNQAFWEDLEQMEQRQNDNQLTLFEL
jgi:hypothetical protein